MLKDFEVDLDTQGKVFLSASWRSATAIELTVHLQRAEGLMATGQLSNMLEESKRGLAAGVHVYYQHTNASDPRSPLEDPSPHTRTTSSIAALRFCHAFFSVMLPMSSSRVSTRPSPRWARRSRATPSASPAS